MPKDVKRSRGEKDLAREPKGTTSDTGIVPTVKRTFSEFSEDNLTDWAAALTYYALLAIFPAILAMVSLIGLFGDPQSTTEKITEIVTEIGPQSAADTFSNPIQALTENRGTAGVMLIVGIAGALWSASGYVGAFMRASNVIYETPEGRPFWELRPLQIVITVSLIVLVALVGVALVLTGPVVEAVAGPLGIGSTAVTVWEIAKWPAILLVVCGIIAVLYYATSPVQLPGFRFITPGGVLAVVVWLLASALFAFYVANFGSYDKTYGTLGGLISALVWLWITNVALLLGAELNAERERNREIAAGRRGAREEIQAEPRGKDKRTTTA